MRYFSEFELVILLGLNVYKVEDFCMGFYFSPTNGWGENVEIYIEYQKTQNGFDKYFFNTLKTKQPELSSLIDDFWEQAKKEKNIIHLFTNIFKDKILIENFKDIIFNNRTGSIIKDYRINFLNKLIQEDSTLFDNLHRHLLRYQDQELLKFYLQLLPKLHQEIQSQDKEKEIWSFLERKKNLTENQSLKLLNIMFKVLNLSEENHQHIFSFFEQYLEKYHDLRKKLKQYENKFFKNFKKEEEKHSLVKTSKMYTFNFHLKANILIDEYNLDKKTAEIFNDEFDCWLLPHLLDKYKNKVHNITYENGITIECQDYNLFLKIEKELEVFKNNLPNIIQYLKEEIQEKKGEIDFSKIAKMSQNMELEKTLNKELNEKNQENNRLKI